MAKVCGFCSKPKEQVKTMIVGASANICNECVDLCRKMLRDQTKEDDTTTIEQSSDPRKIREFLDGYIIGQDDAKVVISVAIANHYKRLHSSDESVELDKTNIILVGPTGSGKTLIAKTVAKYLDVPVTIADATSLTEAGYVGDDVEVIMTSLINAAGGDIERAERGIVFIDEIDKLGRRGDSASISRDVSGEGVQQALLKMVEGTIVRVPANGAARKNPMSDMIEIDTTNILFIVGGAFVGLDKIVTQRQKPSAVGFTSTESSNKDTSICPEDLIKFGLIPEFVGRFPTVVGLSGLTEDSLVEILGGVKNSLLGQYRHLFALDDVDLEFDDDSIRTIAANTMKRNTGARGLRTELERVLMPHMYNLRSYKEQGIKQVRVTAQLVAQPASLTG